MAWRTAYALDDYRAEVNRRFPNRSRASDGTIGDTAHAGQGKGSDHNPWIVRGGVGVVRAFDLTHDPRNGVDCEHLSDLLFEMGKAGDPRLRNGGYLIFNDWITNPDWRQWRRYGGSNKHTSHMHISLSTDRFDDRGSWAPAFPGVVPAPALPTLEDTVKAIISKVDGKVMSPEDAIGYIDYHVNKIRDELKVLPDQIARAVLAQLGK